MLDLSIKQSIASNDRPVALRMRPDLIVRERKSGDKTYFVIKDPIRLAHHQLWEEEFALLQMLDGKASLASMKAAFSAKYKGSRLDTRLLQLLHGQFHRNGLVLSDGGGQSEELYRRSKHLQSQMRWGRFRNWLCIRFRGFNPDSALDYVNERIGWCFERTPFLLITSFVLFTFAFLAVHSASVVARLPTIDEYLTANTLVLIYVSFSVLKVIHEIGHGLACKHYGGECNEMGLMLLVFTPCLYCDVTDSWMVESKWRRAMIGLAGVWFELIAASICMWIWWFSNPGIINSLCFHTMLVGSVFTIFFNGNPLLKYDAYFVISDLLDRPNLYQQARRVVSGGFARFYQKKTPRVTPDPSGRGNGLLWIYGSLASIYRWILFVAIMWIVYSLFHSLRLEWVGLAFIVFTAAAWLLGRLRAMMSVIKAPDRLGNLRAGRVSISVLLAIVLAAVVIWLPLPARVRCPVFLEVKDAKSVVVMVDGRLQSAAAEGTIARAGDEVGRLESKELELNLAARRGELSRQRARLSGLESRRADDASVAARIPTVREAIAGLELEVQRLEADFAQLTLRAPIAGKVLAPPHIDPALNPSDIQVWSGTPLDKDNLGCVLQRGTTFCIVGDVNNFQGTVFLTQGQVELVRAGQQVTIKSQVTPRTQFQGKITEVGTASVREIPAELAKSQVIPTRVNSQGRSESAEPVFTARIEIENKSLHQSAVPPLHQSMGTVTVHVDPQSLGTRIARFVYSTFAIDPTVQQRTSR